MTPRPPRPNNAVTVRREAGFAWQCPFDTRELARILTVMREACEVTAPVELVLTDDRHMAAANAAFMGCTGPTNVLSFPAGASPAGQAVPAPHTERDTVSRNPSTPHSNTASLLLSLDTLEREAILYGQPPQEHTLRLLAHGMAHLAGHDHGPAMSILENNALATGLRALDADRR